MLRGMFCVENSKYIGPLERSYMGQTEKMLANMYINILIMRCRAPAPVMMILLREHSKFVA